MISRLFDQKILISGLCILTCSCSTTVSVTSISPTLEPGSQVDGIPFRTKEHYVLKLYKLDGGKYVPVDTKDTIAPLANQDQLYLLRMKGSALSDGTVKIALNPDNTLSNVKIESASRGQDLLSELGKSMKSLSTAESSLENARSTAVKGIENGLVANEDLHIAALDAQRDAILAQLELDSLPSNSSIIDRTKAEQKLIRTKLIANQKARRANKPLPFSEDGT